MATVQYIKSCRDWLGTSANIHIKHQTGVKCDFSDIFAVRWTGLSISLPADLLGKQPIGFTQNGVKNKKNVK